MSDNYEDYDNYDDDNTSGQGLRAQLKKALAAKAAAEQERDKLRAANVESKGVEILTGKGYKPAVARLAIKDGVDLSNEKALETWLTENGDLFAKPDATQPEVVDGEQPPAPVADAAPPVGAESLFGAIAAIHSAASPAQVNAYERALASIPEDATPAQVRKAFAGL